jgi:hypothetical protein
MLWFFNGLIIGFLFVYGLHILLAVVTILLLNFTSIAA